MQTNRIHISQTLGNRMDVSFYRDRFDFISKTFPSYPLSQLLHVNPSVSYKRLSDDHDISFVPMEVIDEQNGVIAEQRTTKVANNKGFTKFEDNDLLWAKITPCMQNGKSAIARNLVNGCGCGSTEFYVLRPKSNNVLIEYIHYILRDPKVLESAKNSFGGSAGQQRVSSSYLKSIKIPLPPMKVQREIVELYTKAQVEKQTKEAQAKALLDGIDGYLLTELGITLPQTPKRQMAFKVKCSDILGERLNPMSFNATTLALKELINSMDTQKAPLNSLLISSIAGDWGLDEAEETGGGGDYTKCLVIRATEFDNKYNLKLDNSRTKHRKIKSTKLDKMNIQAGDILIEKSGGSPDQPVGRVALITEEVLNNNELAYSNFIHKISLDHSKINSEYCFYYLTTMYNIGMTKSIQSQTNGIRNLIMSSFLKQLVLLPDLKKQEQIAAYIRSMYAQAQTKETEALQALATTKAKIEKIILG